jgi:SsrA-binding protein
MREREEGVWLMSKRDARKKKIVASNKRAYYDYDIADTWEAGMVLLGPEVKALRASNISINEAWVRVSDRSAYLVGASIMSKNLNPWESYKPTRDRKLLLNKHEIKKIKIATYRGFTVIPMQVYFSDRGYAKILIATAKGRRKFDKRQYIKDRDAKRKGELG